MIQALLVLGFAVSFPSQAAVGPKNHAQLPALTYEVGAPMGAEIRAKIVDRAHGRKSADRSPAAASTKKFNEDILARLHGIKDGYDPTTKKYATDRLDELLYDLAPKRDDGSVNPRWLPGSENSYSPEVKYFGAQLALLRPLRSIIYRMRDLLEKKDNRNMHSLSVTMLKSVAANLKIYLPNDQWTVGYDYVTQPSNWGPTNTKFREVSHLQAALVGYTTKINDAIVEISKLYESGEGVPYVWDKQAAYGPHTYKSGESRYAAHHEAEIAATLASLHMTAHSILIFASYNMEEMPEVWGETARLAGVDGLGRLGSIIREGDFGISAENRYNVVRTHADYQKRWKPGSEQRARTEGEKGYFNQAYGHLVKAAALMQDSWTHLQGFQNRPDALMNPINFSGDKEIGRVRVQKWVDLASRNGVELTSTVSGAVTVNLPAFYTSPPEDLKDLLADRYTPGAFELPFKMASGTELKYRNYRRGTPDHWKADKWAPYVSGNPAVAIRVLRESFGGDYVSPFLDAAAW